MSNLYKYAFVKTEEEGPRIIDSNELFEKKLEEKRQMEELRMRRFEELHYGEPDEDGFEGLDTDQLERLTADQDFIGAASDEGAAISSGVDTAQIESMLADAQEQAAQIINDAQAQAEEIKATAAAQGHESGYNDGYQEAMRVAAVREGELNRQAQELEETYRKMLDSIEPEMVDVLTRIYEHIFAVRLQEDKNVILHLLQQTLSKADPTGDFLIHASPADYEMMIDAKDELREMIANPNSNVEVIEDSLLKENECMIETDGGVFDCGLGTELSELAKKLKLLSWSDRE